MSHLITAPKICFFYVETCLYSLIFQIKKHTDQIYFIFGYAEVSNKSVTFLRKKTNISMFFHLHKRKKKNQTYTFNSSYTLIKIGFIYPRSHKNLTVN